MKGGPVGDQPCTVGNDAKLTEIGYRAPRECGIRDNSISLLNETLPIAVNASPKVSYPLLLVSVFQPAERVVALQNKVVFTEFSTC